MIANDQINYYIDKYIPHLYNCKRCGGKVNIFFNNSPAGDLRLKIQCYNHCYSLEHSISGAILKAAVDKIYILDKVLDKMVCDWNEYTTKYR